MTFDDLTTDLAIYIKNHPLQALINLCVLIGLIMGALGLW